MICNCEIFLLMSKPQMSLKIPQTQHQPPDIIRLSQEGHQIVTRPSFRWHLLRSYVLVLVLYFIVPICARKSVTYFTIYSLSEIPWPSAECNILFVTLLQSKNQD